MYDYFTIYNALFRNILNSFYKSKITNKPYTTIITTITTTNRTINHSFVLFFSILKQELNNF